MKKLLIYLICILTFSCTEKNSIKYQDSFEKEKLENIWTLLGNGSISIDESFSHSGKKSLKLESGEGYINRSFLSIDLDHWEGCSGIVSGEFYMFLNEASPDGVHWTMVEVHGHINDSTTAQMRFGGQHQKRLMANYDTQGVSTDCWQHSQTEIPEKEWFKLKWLFDKNEKIMKLWLNDQLMEDIIVGNYGEGCLKNDLNGEWIYPDFKELRLGWVDYQKGGGVRQLWIDDFKLY